MTWHESGFFFVLPQINQIINQAEVTVLIAKGNTTFVNKVKAVGEVVLLFMNGNYPK